MLTFSTRIEGLSAQDFAKAVPAMHESMLVTVKEVLEMGKFLMVRAASGSTLKIKSGSTVQKIAGGTVAGVVVPDGVRGSLRFFARVLNIVEKGAHPKAYGLSSKTGQALKFVVGGRTVFARGTIPIPQRTIRPHPIMGPARRRMKELAEARVPAAAEAALDKVLHAAG